MEHLPLQSFLKQKNASKKELTKMLNLASKKPLLGMIIDDELSKDSKKLLKTILEGLTHIDIEVVVLKDTNVKIKEQKGIKLLPYNRDNRKLLLEASDMALVFSFNDVEEMFHHGTIPISSARDEVSDYDPNKESGNAFIYQEEDPWSIFAALVRAMETYKFTYDWKHIVRSGFESVCNKD